MTHFVRPRGKVVLVSLHKEPHPVDLRDLNFKEASLIGTRVYTRADYRRAMEIVRQLPVSAMVSHRLDIAEGARGFDLMTSPEDVCKVLVTIP
jgi:threonine dehydrogenase-like Zn-dependent dehydrogenase